MKLIHLIPLLLIANCSEFPARGDEGGDSPLRSCLFGFHTPPVSFQDWCLLGNAGESARGFAKRIVLEHVQLHGTRIEDRDALRAAMSRQEWADFRDAEAKRVAAAMSDMKMRFPIMLQKNTPNETFEELISEWQCSQFVEHGTRALEEPTIFARYSPDISMEEVVRLNKSILQAVERETAHLLEEIQTDIFAKTEDGLLLRVYLNRLATPID